MDDIVVNVVNLLKAKNLLDSTYIIFSSDNGFHLGESFFLLPSLLQCVLSVLPFSSVKFVGTPPSTYVYYCYIWLFIIYEQCAATLVLHISSHRADV